MLFQTVFVMTVFIRTMVLHPDVQRRAQEEIDRVIGRDRLPEMADRNSLPYIHATIKELLRCALLILTSLSLLIWLTRKGGVRWRLWVGPLEL